MYYNAEQIIGINWYLITIYLEDYLSEVTGYVQKRVNILI